MNRRWGLSTAVLLVAMYALHQDFWNWHNAERLLGVPIGFAYHIAYCIAASVVLAILTRSQDARRP